MVSENHPENTLNDLEMNLSRELQTKEQRIKELEQSKMIADEENQLILSFLWNEIGGEDLDNLRKLLAGRKLPEILAELDERAKELSKLSSQFESLEEKFKEREESVKARQQETINVFEENIREREEENKVKQETINVLEEKISEREEEVKAKLEIINDLEEKIRKREVKINKSFPPFSYIIKIMIILFILKHYFFYILSIIIFIFCFNYYIGRW